MPANSRWDLIHSLKR